MTLSIRGARERVGYELQKIADDDFLTRWPHIRDNKKKKKKERRKVVVCYIYERSRFPPKYPFAHVCVHVCAFEITDGNHPPWFRWEWRKSNWLLAELRECDCGKKIRNANIIVIFRVQIEDVMFELCILYINVYTKIYIYYI